MNAIVFLGPTLSVRDARRELEALYLPPVSQGDVYRAALRKPQVIGIVDGCFDRVPAVWHKEILWAMSQGIHVYGSGSMGALRAAELAPFGMQGVGEIFEAYRSGALEDDDEVALMHGDEESGHISGSEAMVNVRCTLEHAEAAGVVSSEGRRVIVDAAKALHYPQRVYPMILQRAMDQGLSPEEADALRDWLPAGQVHRKREDAIAMLRAIRDALAAGLEPKQVTYVFEHTEMWDHASRTAGTLRYDAGAAPQMLHHEPVLDEARLQPHVWTRVSAAALLRFLALNEARRQGWIASGHALEERIEGFIRERGLTNPGDLADWLDANELTREQFVALVAEDAGLRWVGAMAAPELDAHRQTELRVAGLYRELLARAHRKQRLLKEHGLQDASPAALKLTAEQVMRWYFEDVLGVSVPADLDAYAREHGFEDRGMFQRAVVNECAFRTVGTGGKPRVRRRRRRPLSVAR